MAPPEVTDADIVNGFADIMREKGYEASSLKELSVRLRVGNDLFAKYYPGGKQAIALAVVVYMQEWSKQFVTDVLLNRAASPGERLDVVLMHLNQLYDGGRTNCLMRVLSTRTGVDLMGVELQKVINGCVDAFTRLGEDFGQAGPSAYENAGKALGLVKKSIVLAAALDGKEAFQTALAEIGDIYLPVGERRGKE